MPEDRYAPVDVVELVGLPRCHIGLRKLPAPADLSPDPCSGFAKILCGHTFQVHVDPFGGCEVLRPVYATAVEVPLPGSTDALVQAFPLGA